MSIFKRRDIEPEPVMSDLPCKHKYRDFNWYVDAVFYIDTKQLHIKIIEPYVCVYCKDRRDVVLEETNVYVKNAEEATKYTEDNYDKRYPDKIKPRVVVEDEINDVILVDREYITLFDKLYEERMKRYAGRY